MSPSAAQLEAKQTFTFPLLHPLFGPRGTGRNMVYRIRELPIALVVERAGVSVTYNSDLRVSIVIPHTLAALGKIYELQVESP